MTAPVADRATIERAQNGDKAAFEEILRAHYDVMYRIAFKWCGSQSDAEDITQNACIKLARSIDSFQFQSAFLTWLYALVINTAKDWMKSHARHPSRELPENHRAEQPTAENAVFASQTMAYIRDFPDKEKEALFLVFGEGLTHGDAAAVMDCKESTVSWYIHEARKKLQSFREVECRHG